MRPETVADSELRVDDPVPPFPSPLLAGLIVLAVMLLYFWLSGALFASNVTNYRLSSAQVTGMALTYSTTPAFLITALLFARRRTRAVLDELVVTGSVEVENARTVGEGDSVDGFVANAALTAVGACTGAIQLSWEAIAESLGEPTMYMVLSIAIGNIVTWIAVAHIIFRRVVASIKLCRLGREHTRIDLLRLDTLLPYGRIATLHVLVVAIAISLSAFQSLDAELRWVNYSSAFAAGIPAGLALLLLPMSGVRRRVREAKSNALEELDRAIAHADRALEPEPLHYLSNLLQQRESIQRSREWPLDTSAFSKIAIYFVIPPIAWVGGAIAEILIEAAL